MTIAVSTTIKPLGDRVLLKPKTKEEVTRSGIVLPDTAKEKPLEGTIIAVGPGKALDDGRKVPMDVAAGQVVLYAKYAGTEIKMDGEDYLILRQEDILAIKGE
ncbi:MAG: co-chaperone GroES [Chloroflexi bacterium]|nr:co-chaperone GroES [Chloroflexota bacterium]MDA8188256.1 co-chaperone GroES [Dehalococcoidales bacterium]